MEVMIDLETLSSRPDAAIVSIGAYRFDPNAEPELVLDSNRAFHVAISFQDALRYGHVDGDTLRWWFQQSDEARQSVLGSSQGVWPASTGRAGSQNLGERVYRLSEALEWLDVFLGGLTIEARYWSHATFDMPILEHAYTMLGKRRPWNYTRCRDLRTLFDEAGYGNREKLFSEGPQRTGTHHSAMWDAFFQARQVQWIRGLHRG